MAGTRPAETPTAVRQAQRTGPLVPCLPITKRRRGRGWGNLSPARPLTSSLATLPALRPPQPAQATTMRQALDALTAQLERMSHDEGVSGGGKLRVRLHEEGRERERGIGW
jgi:hypothetical protein